MSKDSSPPFVLILQDEPHVRVPLARFIEKAGYRVRAARSAREALSFLGPDLEAAILDVVLVSSGGLSGVDVLAAIRQMPGGFDVPVLVFTVFAYSSAVQRAIREYHADVKQKPAAPGEIVDWLRERIQP